MALIETVRGDLCGAEAASLVEPHCGELPNLDESLNGPRATKRLPSGRIQLSDQEELLLRCIGGGEEAALGAEAAALKDASPVRRARRRNMRQNLGCRSPCRSPRCFDYVRFSPTRGLYHTWCV